MIFDEFAKNYFVRLGELRGSLDYMHDNRLDNMRSILLDMYFMGFDARAYRVSGIVTDVNNLGYDDWAKVPQKVQARLMYDNYRLED